MDSLGGATDPKQAALHALLARATLGARLWHRLPHLKEVCLRLSARFDPEDVIGALLDEEDMGKHLQRPVPGLTWPTTVIGSGPSTASVNSARGCSPAA